MKERPIGEGKVTDLPFRITSHPRPFSTVIVTAICSLGEVTTSAAAPAVAAMPSTAAASKFPTAATSLFELFFIAFFSLWKSIPKRAVAGNGAL